MSSVTNTPQADLMYPYAKAVDDYLKTSEDTARTITTEDLFGKDGKGMENDSSLIDFTHIVISTLGVNGTLKLDGYPVTKDQIIRVSDIEAGKLTFIPNGNFNGEASFQYRASNGIDTSNIATVHIAVSNSNDAPVAVSDVLSTKEDIALTIKDTDLFGSDGTGKANDSDLDSSKFASITITALPTHGTLALDGKAVALNQVVAVADLQAGKLVFTPEAQYAGVADFKYTVSDGTLNSNQATVSINIGAANDAPVSVDDHVHTKEETNLTLLGSDFFGTDGTGKNNDYDLDSTSFKYLQVSSLPNGGVLKLNGVAVTSGQSITVEAVNAGKLVFVPNKDFAGEAVFSYRLSDGSNFGNAAKMHIHVDDVNDAPVAVDDKLAGKEDTALTITEAALFGVDNSGGVNDRDVDAGNFASITITKLASNGTLKLDGKDVTLNQVVSQADLSAGKLTFVPNKDFHGDAAFKYKVSDGELLSNEATVTINVNAAPVAVDDNIAGKEDTITQITLEKLIGSDGAGKVNDYDVDSKLVSIKVTSLPNDGVLKFGGVEVKAGQVLKLADFASKALTFTPNADYHGDAKFKYTLSDGIQDSNEATVTLAVASVQDAPRAADDKLSTKEDTALTIKSADLFGSDGVGKVNDFGPDSTSFSHIVVKALGVNGTLKLDGALVTLDQIIKVADIDAGKLTFVPNANFSGNASFKYAVSDGSMTSNVANVNITVGAYNDAPVAVNDTLSTSEDTALTIKAVDLFGSDGAGKLNDSDIDSSSFTSITITALASNGTLKLDGKEVTANQVITTADLTAGKLTFVPHANFTGNAQFKYTVSDGTASSNEASVTVKVNAVNDAPVSVDDHVHTKEDTNFTLLGSDFFGTDGIGKNNDYDLDSAAFKLIQVTSIPKDGVLKFNGVAVTVGQALSVDAVNAGKLVFVPNKDFNGEATFGYRLSDGSKYGNEAKMHIHVDAVNDAPVAVDDKLAGKEDTALTITEAALFGVDNSGGVNDRDVDAGNFASITITKLASNGTLKLDGKDVTLNQVVSQADLSAGKLTFVPNKDFHGDAAFKYKVSDGELLSNEATVTINVNAAPVAIDDNIAGKEDTVTQITLEKLIGSDGAGKVNDYDVDSKLVSMKVTALPTDGVLKFGGVEIKVGQELKFADFANKPLTFTPNTNYHGDAKFKYTVNDGIQDSNEATVTVSVAAVHDAPVAVNDKLSAKEDVALVIKSADLFGSDGVGKENDYGVDSTAFTHIIIKELPLHGSLKLDGSAVTLGQIIKTADLDANKLSYISNANDWSDASFKYVVSDGINTSNVATVNIDVSAVNDKPVAVDDVLKGVEDTTRVVDWGDLFSTILGTPGAVRNDYDDNPAVSITITSLASNGTLKLDGVAVKLNQVISVADLKANKLTFTPDADFTGAAQFKYTANDGEFDSNEAKVTINVANVNDKPVGVDDVLQGKEDTKLTILGSDLFGTDSTGKNNDYDVDGGSFHHITIKTLAVNGVLHLNGVAVTAGQHIPVTDVNAGKLTFTPNANFNGDASFQYTISDGTLHSGMTTATIKVAAVNDAPVAVNDVINVKAAGGTISATDLFGADASGKVNDYDVDGDKFSYITITSVPEHATLYHVHLMQTLEAGGTAKVSEVFEPVKAGETFTMKELTDGHLRIQPEKGFSGKASFKYSVNDGALNSNEATVTVNVNAAPVAVDDKLAGKEDTVTTITPAQLVGTDGVGKVNDYDVDSNFVSMKVTALPTDGVLKFGGVEIKVGQELKFADFANKPLTFTPNANFHGDAKFKYTISDGAQDSNEATVTVVVASVQDAPVAVDDKFSGKEDTALTIQSADLFGSDGVGKVNDSGVDSASFTHIVVKAVGVNGILKLDGSAVTLDQIIKVADIDAGKLTFVPNANFSGNATFKYAVSDGSMLSNAATVTVVVGANNDAPVAVNDTLSAKEDTTLTIKPVDLFGTDGTGKLNDSDVDTANFASIKITTLASNGTLKLDGTAITLNQVVSVGDLAAGKLTFVPDTNFNGNASFKYSVNDGTFSSNEASVTINVAASNDAPVSVDDHVNTKEETSLTLLGSDFFSTDGVGKTNDYDIDSASFKYLQVTTLPSGGVLKLDGIAVTAGQAISVDAVNAGKLVFTPNKDFAGDAVFGYRLSDGTTYGNTAKMHIHVDNVNDAPVATNDVLTGKEDTALTINANTLFGSDGTGKVNDADIDSASFASITITKLASNGSLTLNGQAVTLNQIISADDLKADKLSFKPNADFHGKAEFNYTVSDGLLNSNEATVTINVNAAPVAVDDKIAGKEDTVTQITLEKLIGSDGAGKVNDYDADSKLVSIKVTSLPDDGVLKFGGAEVKAGQVLQLADFANKQLTFTPKANFNGDVKFKYTISDGLQDSNEAVVTVTVAAVQDAPVAVNDKLSTQEDTTLTIKSSALFGTDGVGQSNDYGPDSKEFTYITIKSLATNGTLKLDGSAVTLGQIIKVADLDSGKLSFTPNANFAGNADFKYSVNDGSMESNIASVTITVGANNDAPVAVNDNLNTAEDKALTIKPVDLFGSDGTGKVNDYDLDTANFASIKITALASNGTLKLDGTAVTANQTISVADLTAGKLTFVPNANFSGNASFKYTVSDGVASSNEATVTVKVGAANDAPVSVDDHTNTKEETSLILLGSDFFGTDGTGKNNDYDIDSDSFKFLQVSTLPVGGVLKLNGVAVKAGEAMTIEAVNAGKLIFTPNKDFAGEAIFDYRLSDGTSFGNSAKMHIHVENVNDAPIAKDDTINYVDGHAQVLKTSDFLGADGTGSINDSDADGKVSSITITELPSQGYLTLGGEMIGMNQVISISDLDAGKLKFIPTSHGDAEFKYTLNDGTVNSNEALVSLKEVPGTSTTGTKMISGTDAADTLDASAGKDNFTGGLGADTFVWKLDDVQAGTHTDKVTDFNTGETLDLTDLVSHGASLVIDNTSHTITAEYCDGEGVHTQLIQVAFDSGVTGSHDLKDIGGGVIKIG